MGVHYSHLSQADSVAIQLLLQAGCSRRLALRPPEVAARIVPGHWQAI